VVRKEDPALLSGRGRYADDLPVPAGTLQAHVIRSPHPHADIVKIDATAALAKDGVWAVITGADVKKISDPFLVALKSPIHQWSLAVDRVRFVGEPVALVVAESRYLAEDAAELVQIEYAPLETVIDPLAACKPDSPILHPEAKTNEISVRKFHYGDTRGAFNKADKIVKLTVDFHRLSFTPMECFVVVATHNPADDSFDCMANFQGPFSTHPVMARALRVPGPKMRLRIPPDSGGSFGIKLSVFPYVVLTALAAKITGRAVKWVEDRAEHLLAASSGPNRVTEIEAAVTRDGKILGLKMDQLEDYGAFLRAPMPGPLYRMHGAVTGGYDVPNIDVINRVVLTNKMPASLIRGFGGPQLYLALERLVQRIAVELGLDHLDVIRRNLVPAHKFPYRAAAGGLYDSGDYPRAVEMAIGDGRLEYLKKRRDEARKAGKKYGIGFAVVVEPAMSNMGYLSTLLTPETRDKAGPKNGATSMVTVNVDPLGAVSVTADVTVQGQGHETVLSQIVADQLGLQPGDVDVTLEMDTAKDQWSIAAGTYSGNRRRGAHGGGAIGRKAQGHRGEAAQRHGRRRRAVRRQDPQQEQPRQRAAVRPRRRHLALVAGDAAPRHGAGAERDRGVESARIGAAVERRPHQHLAHLRFRIRHVRYRDRSGDLSGQGRPLRVDARRRQNPQSAGRRGPDARRLRAGHCRGALRGVRHQRGRCVPERHVRGLSGADGERNSTGRAIAHRVAVAVHAAWRQGPSRRQLHECAGLHR
jgi:2-furoyl-CoA dehydrogenase large subunit